MQTTHIFPASLGATPRLTPAGIAARSRRLRRARLRLAAGAIALALSSASLAESPPWLLGADGSRQALIDRGIAPYLNYHAETASALNGDYDGDHSTRYADQFTLGAYLNTGKLWGWHNTEVRVHTTLGHGRDLSKELTDPRQPMVASSVQEVWGSLQQWRLGGLWLRRYSDDGKWDVKVGRIAEGEDFAQAGCFFQNLSMCGTLVGNGINIWYNAPRAMWAVRVKHMLTPQVRLQYGLYQHNPSLLENDARFSLKFSGGEGFMHLGEVFWQTQVGPHALPGNYWLGSYFNTSNHKDFYLDVNNNPQALTGLDFKEHSDRYGTYFVFNQQLTRFDGDNSRGFVALFNVVANDRKTATADYQIQAGFKLKGPFDARPRDDIGLGFSRLHINDQRALNAQLRNHITGVSDFNDPNFVPVQFAEMATELHYTYNYSRAVMLRPNLQYVKHPGGVREVPSALVGGLSLRLVF